MVEIDPTSINGPTPGCSTMSNLPSCQVMTNNMPVAGPSGISHTSYEDSRADFQVSLCAIVKRNYINFCFFVFFFVFFLFFFINHR
jgi:hypothetical protein